MTDRVLNLPMILPLIRNYVPGESKPMDSASSIPFQVNPDGSVFQGCSSSGYTPGINGTVGLGPALGSTQCSITPFVNRVRQAGTFTCTLQEDGNGNVKLNCKK